MHFGKIVKGEEVLDEVVVGLFKSPHSYTTEDVVEISCHGSDFIANKVLDLVLEGGARLAERGEFTMRAFLAGRIDLVQAEGVLGVIAAQSSVRRDQQHR